MLFAVPGIEVNKKIKERKKMSIWNRLGKIEQKIKQIECKHIYFSVCLNRTGVNIYEVVGVCPLCEATTTVPLDEKEISFAQKLFERIEAKAPVGHRSQ